MGEEFVSELIRPVAGSFDVGGMARGEPGLPSRFMWRDKEYAVAEVLEKNKIKPIWMDQDSKPKPGEHKTTPQKPSSGEGRNLKTYTYRPKSSKKDIPH